jgi:hypothetical protein
VGQTGQVICAQCGFNWKTGKLSDKKAVPASRFTRRMTPDSEKKASPLAALPLLIMMVLAVLTAYFAYRHYVPGGPRDGSASHPGARIYYAETLSPFVDVMFQPLDAAAPNPADIQSFAEKCRTRASPGRDDAEIAQLSLRLCAMLNDAAEIRQSYEEKLRHYAQNPPASLGGSGGDTQRRQQLFMDTLARQPWVETSRDLRAEATTLLEMIAVRERNLYGESTSKERGSGPTLWEDVAAGYAGLYRKLKGAVTRAPPLVSATNIAPAAAQRPASVCETCKGAGRITCAACGGAGTLEKVISTPCQQCGGTGVRKSRLSGGGSPCPFCNKTGSLQKKSREPCSACAGRAWTVCPTCGAAAAGRSSEKHPL